MGHYASEIADYREEFEGKVRELRRCRDIVAHLEAALKPMPGTISPGWIAARQRTEEAIFWTQKHQPTIYEWEWAHYGYDASTLEPIKADIR